MTPVSPVLPSNPRSKEVEVVFGANQTKDYSPLPAIKVADKEGRVITSWHLTLWERLRVLWTGRIYLQQLTFNQLLQPQLMTVDEPEITIE